MSFSWPARIMLGAGLCLIAIGVGLLLRLRRLPGGSPAAYACRIAGTMAFMLGLILIVFITTFALTGAP